ncbi:MAG: hypothetical protein R3F59_01085 [Myxococcota bacterium]
MWMALAAAAAWAGSGPWVVGEGQGSVYLGGEAQRLTRLAITVDGDRQVIDVGEGLSALGIKAIGSVGLTPHVELEATLPFWRVQANRPDDELCGALGLGACRTTTSVGVLALRGKGLLLDEVYGAPLSFALGAEVRSGDLTSGTRERITNVGEGGLDTGLFASVGRSGALGGGSYAGYVEVLGRYRFPLTRAYPDNRGNGIAPGSELQGTADLLLGPGRRFSVGPIVGALWRPWGLDWGELDLGDRDRLGALRVLNAQVGATAVVRGPGDLAASLTVLRTVAAVNNPTDTLSISAGVQTLLRTRERDRDE